MVFPPSPCRTCCLCDKPTRSVNSMRIEEEGFATDESIVCHDCVRAAVRSMSMDPCSVSAASSRTTCGTCHHDANPAFAAGFFTPPPFVEPELPTTGTSPIEKCEIDLLCYETLEDEEDERPHMAGGDIGGGHRANGGGAALDHIQRPKPDVGVDVGMEIDGRGFGDISDLEDPESECHVTANMMADCMDSLSVVDTDTTVAGEAMPVSDDLRRVAGTCLEWWSSQQEQAWDQCLKTMCCKDVGVGGQAPFNPFKNLLSFTVTECL